jgi:hypothetical protein
MTVAANAVCRNAIWIAGPVARAAGPNHLPERSEVMSIRLTVVLCILSVGAFMAQSLAQEISAASATRPAASAPTSSPLGKLLQPLPNEKNKPFAVVTRAKTAPTLDGKIEPDVWGDKPTLTNFFDDETSKPVAKDVQTLVWLLYDEEKLYIAAKMLEPKMDELTAEVTTRDGDVWRDDDLEIFLDPGKKKDPSDYFQIVVNALGTLTDQRGAPDVSGDVAWDCKGCTVKAAKGKDFWAIEMAIPLKALGVTKPLAGARWGVNFARDRKAGAAEKGSWANMGPQWHQPDQFATIVFQP